MHEIPEPLDLVTALIFIAPVIISGMFWLVLYDIRRRDKNDLNKQNKPGSAKKRPS